jgi:hypothetical protein
MSIWSSGRKRPLDLARAEGGSGGEAPNLAHADGWSGGKALTLARLSCGGENCGALHLLLRVASAEEDAEVLRRRRKVKPPRWREGIASASATKPHRQRRKKLRAEGECRAIVPEKVRWG